MNTLPDVTPALALFELDPAGNGSSFVLTREVLERAQAAYEQYGVLASLVSSLPGEPDFDLNQPQSAANQSTHTPNFLPNVLVLKRRDSLGAMRYFHAQLFALAVHVARLKGEMPPPAARIAPSNRGTGEKRARDDDDVIILDAAPAAKKTKKTQTTKEDARVKDAPAWHVFFLYWVTDDSSEHTIYMFNEDSTPDAPVIKAILERTIKAALAEKKKPNTVTLVHMFQYFAVGEYDEDDVLVTPEMRAIGDTGNWKRLDLDEDDTSVVFDDAASVTCVPLVQYYK